MPKIRDYAITVESVAVASSVLEMPAHQTGDLLLIFFNKDTAAGGPTLPTGWTQLASVNSAGANATVFGKKAVSSAEAVTLSYTSETSVSVVVSVKNVFGTTITDAISATASAAADDGTLPLSGGTITPLHNNCLVLGMLSTDSGIGPSSLPGWVTLFGGDAGANSLGLSYTFQRTAAALTHPGYWAAAQDDSRSVLLAVRDSGTNEEIDPYVDRATIPAQVIAAMAFEPNADQGTWQNGNATQLLTLAGKTVSGVTGAAAADSGYNPFRAAMRHTTTNSKTGISATQLTFATARDLTFGSGVVFGTWRPQVPRDYLDMGKPSNGGIYLRFADASNNHKAWLLGGQFTESTDPANRQNFAIQVGQTQTTTWDATGTLATNAVNRLFVGGNGYYGASALEWSELWALNETVLAGGTASVPLGFTDLVFAVNRGSGDIPVIVRNGAAATVWTRLAIGGGDPVHINVGLRTFQWPQRTDGVDYFDFHVDASHLGIEFDAKAGDTCKFVNCVFTSPSPYYWRIGGTASASATWSFAGTSVVGATVTLQPVTTFSNMAFTDCATMTQNGATISNCTFSNTTVTASNPNVISSCSFTSGGTGHAMIIPSAGTYTFSNLTFTGYAASNGSTGNETVYVTATSGAVVINVTGGTIPTYRTAGATVTVNASALVTLTGLKAGSEVRAYVGTNPATATEIAGVESSSTSFEFSQSVSGQDGYIVIFAVGYKDIVLPLTYSASNRELPIQQVLDRVYLNPPN